MKQTDIFEAGKEDYHTYRIPALVVTGKGTILAFCEGRKNSARDQGEIDLVLKRSFDNGKTWGKMLIVKDDDKNTIGNPCPVVDQDTGIIWLPFCRNNDQVFVTKSTDDGETWSSPEEITGDVKLPSWRFYGTGPTHGTQLKSGRLLIPCYHSELGPIRWTGASHMIYSDDHGSTWKLGSNTKKFRGECVVVETMDGSVYLNIRCSLKNSRAYAWSRDGGETWSEEKLEPTLIDPGPIHGQGCQASLIRYTKEQHNNRNRILFSNPASARRERMTVRISYDECQTWTISKVLHFGPSAYSDLCIAKDMTICCLYERSEEGPYPFEKIYPYEKITFAQFSLEWLTDGVDRV